MSGASLFMVSVMVPAMDAAIAHSVRDWGFVLAQDSAHDSGHRWVEVAPDGGARLRLVEARTDAERAVIGQQVADRVAFFIRVANFDSAIARWHSNGIEIAEPPRSETYGRVAVLRDKFGNRWDAFDAEPVGQS